MDGASAATFFLHSLVPCLTFAAWFDIVSTHILGRVWCSPGAELAVVQRRLLRVLRYAGFCQPVRQSLEGGFIGNDAKLMCDSSLVGDLTLTIEKLNVTGTPAGVNCVWCKWIRKCSSKRELKDIKAEVWSVWG